MSQLKCPDCGAPLNARAGCPGDFVCIPCGEVICPHFPEGAGPCSPEGAPSSSDASEASGLGAELEQEIFELEREVGLPPEWKAIARLRLQRACECLQRIGMTVTEAQEALKFVPGTLGADRHRGGEASGASTSIPTFPEIAEEAFSILKYPAGAPQTPRAPQAPREPVQPPQEAVQPPASEASPWVLESRQNALEVATGGRDGEDGKWKKRVDLAVEAIEALFETPEAAIWVKWDAERGAPVGAELNRRGALWSLLMKLTLVERYPTGGVGH